MRSDNECLAYFSSRCKKNVSKLIGFFFKLVVLDESFLNRVKNDRSFRVKLWMLVNALFEFIREDELGVYVCYYVIIGFTY